MDLQVRMREYERGKRKSPQERIHPKLWLPCCGYATRTIHKTRAGKDQIVPHMERNAYTLLQQQIKQVPPLWSKRNHGLRGMEGRLRGLSDMGSGERVSGQPHHRAEGQRRPVQPGKLPLGNKKRAGKPHKSKPRGYNQRCDKNSLSVGGRAWHKDQRCLWPFAERVAHRKSSNRENKTKGMTNNGPARNR